MRSALLAATCGVALAGAARSEQSLGEAARRERERRAASGAARTYTESDLAAGRSAAAPAAPAQPTPAPSASPAPASSAEAAERAALEKRWRERFDEARQRLRDADSRAYETVVEPVFVGDGRKGVWVPMQVRRRMETEELRQARRALVDLEEELRVAGLPPGWGRE